MVKKTAKVDRRRHSRFKLKEGTYASLNSSGMQLGEIVNISKNGVALRIPFEEDDVEPPISPLKDHGQLDINLFAMNGTAIFNLPAQTISNEIQKDHSIKRAAFGNVESSRKAMIDLFIQMFQAE